MERIMQSEIRPDQTEAHRLLVQVANGRSTASYESNQKIFTQGEVAAFVYFIQDGCVKLTRLEDGIENLLGSAARTIFWRSMPSWCAGPNCYSDGNKWLPYHFGHERSDAFYDSQPA
jgi:hypothetical protein